MGSKDATFLKINEYDDLSTDFVHLLLVKLDISFEPDDIYIRVTQEDIQNELSFHFGRLYPLAQKVFSRVLYRVWKEKVLKEGHRVNHFSSKCEYHYLI